MTETIKADFHTHTTYCDGKNSVRDMFEAAKAAGMEAIGFSGHSHTPFDESYCMSDEETKKYIDEINGLKRSNVSSTEVYLGLEKDRFSDADDTSAFDYVIGSLCVQRRLLSAGGRKPGTVQVKYRQVLRRGHLRLLRGLFQPCRLLCRR